MPARLIERRHGDRLISTDPTRVDVVAAHRDLSHDSHWAAGRTRDTQRRAIDHSHLVAGVDDPDGSRVGFGRMVSDPATCAWLADVDVLDPARGAGFGTELVETIVGHPDVVDVTWQFLVTRDAHEMSARLGDTPLTSPDDWMHRRVPT